MEWLFLREAMAGALKELILEHRIPSEEGDAVGEGIPWPKTRESTFPSTEVYRGQQLFYRSVLRFLLEHSGRFSNLWHLALRGIPIVPKDLRGSR
jgi:hypothetical protein